MERGVLTGLVVFRWAGWLWMATVLVLARRSLEHGMVAAALVGAALVVTALDTRWLLRAPSRLLDPGPVSMELTVGAALLLADGFVYDHLHVFSPEQNLGVAWPLAGVLAAGVARGPLLGGAAGILLGLARAGSAIVNAPALEPGYTGVVIGGLKPEWLLSLVSTTVLYCLAGGVAGYVSRLLRRAEREISTARAREEIARTLHDGVLQTLALVERRTDDPRLARLARDQERELREFLFGSPATDVIGGGDLGEALRAAAARFEERFGGRVAVLVPDDLPPLPDEVIRALEGAVGEALANAGRHGEASRVTVFVEPGDGAVFCSVKDDGHGFDPGAVAEGMGLRESVRGRIREVGGEVEVSGAPGRGAEVTMTVPVGRTRTRRPDGA